MKKGISLIVLVITIIVMIILAATIIISLNNTGIIGAAENAVCMTNIKQAQNLAVLTWSNIYTKPDEYTMDNIEEKLQEEFEKNGLKYEDYNIEVTKNGINVSSKAGCVDSSGVEGGSGGSGEADANINILEEYIFGGNPAGKAYLTELSEDGKNYKGNTELGIADGDVKGVSVTNVKDGVMAYIQYKGNKYKFKIDSNMNTVPSYGLVRILPTDWMYAFSYDRTQNTWTGVHDAVTQPGGDIVAIIYQLDETVDIEDKDYDDPFTYPAHKMIISGTGTYDFYIEDWYDETYISIDDLTGTEDEHIAYTVKEVVIQDGITALADYAFAYYYNSLEKITVPSNITSMGKAVFGGTSLKEFTIPQGITRIEESSFEECKFESIVIPDSVTYIDGGAFSHCTNLKNVKFSKNLTGFGDGNPDNYRNGVFEGCESLETITVPGTIETIPFATFKDCTSLKTVVISDGVKVIDDRAFYGCSALTDISISNTVTEIYSAFPYCTSLKTITLPASLEKLGNYNKYDGTFLECTSLTTINYKGTQEKWNSIIRNLYIPSTATIVYNYTGN